ncbi:MAG TPA: NAD-glutamate dehydrogenase domain-containing protein, partial [Ilumatobacteraceae bacterium]|nr:NAD-glutamate dehydrogenase domain-containing protein [Ilumatobacteraceae bacterium]
MRHDTDHAEPGLVHPEVAAALGRLAELATTRQPDEAVLPEFLARYYRELPEPDLDDRRLDALYSVAVAHFRIGRQRRPGETLARVISPDTGLDESRPPRSILFVVTDDAPFLVDTIRMAVERHRLDIHLMVHPMLDVARDDSGVATRVAPAAGPTEAWTQVEIDYCDAVAAARLEADALAAVADVHLVVEDFPAMRDRMAALTELDPILEWLAFENFVFLGAAEYDRTDHGLVVRHGTQLGQLRAEHEIDPPPVEADSPLGAVVISRSEAASTIHRGSRRTCVSVRDGDLEHRFVGLPASGVYRQSALSIPTVGDRARAVLALVDAGMETHTGRSIRNTLETLPRDLLFELDADRLAHLVIDIVGLQERQLVRIFDVAEPVGAWSTVLVYVPRTRFTARLPEIVAEAVAAAYHSSYRDVESLVGASTLARITLTVRRPDGVPPVLDRLADVVDELTTSWDDRLRSVLTRQLGAAAGRSLYERVGVHAPADFRANVPPARAVSDLERIDRLLASGHGLTSEMNHDESAPADEWRFRVYRRGEPAALSELLPLLAHLGLVALDERPSTFVIGADRVHLYDIGVRVPPGTDVGTAQSELESTFEGLMSGDVEADGFNRLVSVAGLTARQVSVLRAYAKYLRQIGFAFSQSYIEDTFSRLPHLATRLTELFEAKFDPALADREAALVAARGSLTIDLDAIQLLDDDRICRAFLMLIDATVRTNRYLGKPTLSFKLDPAAIPDLPRPRPMYEIFVCSPRVEGVHLRAGPIARGGIRWSDRREDFRTEVLGLVKAQMVKNAVIVPVGAKGGFVVKTPMGDPAQHRIEGEECYREFVRGMLDLTDNVVGGVLEHPPDMVIYDGDDPYLVVAADKGTATFSDIANAVAAEYGFWLGDAFASGGSAGYDHKVMGITARGAWESIRRHARVLGKDADSDPITAVGIGDMSGDVFGNGMLRSRHLRLIAAFDHRHIFIDPDPDAELAFHERKRLFGLPRSSWDDYDTRLISTGGGVYPRSAKSIALSVDARTALGTTAERVTPIELIRIILTAPVDLLWNGGIGTYVKASSETHADVGDRANDALRVDASELRCRMVGEGGNLGFTQLGRVEYALADGLIYNDAVDNSGGVDCSDHEVNIKILLSDVVAAG